MVVRSGMSSLCGRTLRGSIFVFKKSFKFKVGMSLGNDEFDEDTRLQLDENAFDVVILGTGLPNSILAAALARSGKRVLHADTESFYGHSWTSFSFNEFLTCLDKLPIASQSLPISDISYVVSELCPLENLKKLSRQFILDLRCRLLFARSEGVETLIRSGVGNYMQFRPCNLCYTFDESKDALVRVPTSKQQVFCTNLLVPADKRRLMKLLHLVLDDAHTSSPSNENSHELDEFSDRPFYEYLQARSLSDRLIKLVLYSLCMASSDTDLTTSDALCRLRLLLQSFGRFSSGALLLPVYGTAEFPQAFCRLAAVYGATYILRCQSLRIQCAGAEFRFGDALDRETVQAITCESVVADAEHRAHLSTEDDSDQTLPEDRIHVPQHSAMRTSRCICITRSPLEGSLVAEESSPGLCVATLAPNAKQNPSAVRIVQLDHTTLMCPEGYYIVHMSTPCSDGSRQDLEHIVNELIAEHESRLFTAFFCIAISDADTPTIDVDDAIVWARNMFERLCPEEEFLPSKDGDESARDRDAFVREAFEALVQDDVHTATL